MANDILKIRCPACRSMLALTKKLARCEQCGRRFGNSTGIIDLVDSADRHEERAFYDEVYSRDDSERATKLTIQDTAGDWGLPHAPENQLVLECAGNLAGKNILLLGNGDSLKELFFLKSQPQHLVYSDLSIQALSKIKNMFDLVTYDENLTFAAIDAQDIPFSENFFDVVYGSAVVHHLPNLERFFDSVIRVLKPGGRGVFMDDAYAPLWHYSKQTWLKPLMKFSHQKAGISPEDYRFSMMGGFKEVELAEKITRAGGRPWFKRKSLLSYFAYRAADKVLPECIGRALTRPTVATIIMQADSILCRLPVMKKNQIRLIWGFEKR